MPPKFYNPRDVHVRKKDREYYEKLVFSYNNRFSNMKGSFKIPGDMVGKVVNYLYANQSNDINEALNFYHSLGDKF